VNFRREEIFLRSEHTTSVHNLINFNISSEDTDMEVDDYHKFVAGPIGESV
jgi:hypothetical protein